MMGDLDEDVAPARSDLPESPSAASNTRIVDPLRRIQHVRPRIAVFERGTFVCLRTVSAFPAMT